MRFKPQKYRCFLLRGTATLATTLLLFVGLGCHGSKSTGSNAEQPLTETTTTTTITITTETTTSTSVETTTTELTTTTAEVTTTEIIPATEEVVTEPEVATEPEVVTEPETISEPEEVETSLPITEQEWILIANVVSHEAGCSWISEYERVCIVAAIMNRVADSRFPNTVDGVLHQSGQFFDVPYYRVDYSGIGFEPIDRAIDAYFNGEYNCGNINSWSGDGSHNYFYYQ